METMSDEDAEAILYDWSFWARNEQLAPDWDWVCWLILAGRGFGKTRTGAQWTIQKQTEGSGRIALIGETAADVRDVMVEGEAGIMACSPPWNRPVYTPSKRKLVWPNGAQAFTYSAEEPDQLRGPAHDAAWADEIAKWRYPDTWDQAMFGLRLGKKPQVCATTTPRPIKLLKDLLNDDTTHPTRGSTYDNRANLPKSFFKKVIAKYEGTRLGRQELNAEMLDDVPGALWSRDLIDAMRRKPKECPEYVRITVNIDPAVSNNEGSDETGLTVTAKGVDDHCYVLADESGKYSPTEWAIKAIALYRNFQADCIVAEVNNGGDLVEANLRAQDEDIPYKAVHASRGKKARAEPISTIYEKKKVHHVGSFPILEDQMCAMATDFDKKKMGYSPDRVDSLVWGITELMLEDNHDGMLRFARAQGMREQEEKKASEALVRMKAPENTQTVYTRTGERLYVDTDGCVMIRESEVKAMRGAGFREMKQ